MISLITPSLTFRHFMSLAAVCQDEIPHPGQIILWPALIVSYGSTLSQIYMEPSLDEALVRSR